jgi:SAM-dependent methyltransferase
MEKIVSSPLPPGPPAAPDFPAVKARQRATWSSGDYAVVGTTLQIVGEELCEAVDLRAGQAVLDVAAGNGNASLAAARRFCRVTAVDYVPALLERAGERARASRLDLTLREADAEALPFPDGAFDAVLSTFGVMFAPDQARAAAELARVCAAGGRVGLACWTPDGFVGQLFRSVARHLPPPPGLPSPARWGTREGIGELLGGCSRSITHRLQTFTFRYRSAAHWLDVFRSSYGPVLKAFAALDEDGRASLADDLLQLVARFNRSGDETVVVPGEYLQTVVVRR